MSINPKSYRQMDASQLHARLKHRVRIEAPLHQPDNLGGAATTWQLVTQCWTAIHPVSRGNETLFAGKLQAEMSHKFILRYRPNLTAKMRIVFGQRIFNIRRIQNIDEANVLLEILADENVAI